MRRGEGGLLVEVRGTGKLSESTGGGGGCSRGGGSLRTVLGEADE